jgi:O-antigen ligase
MNYAPSVPVSGRPHPGLAALAALAAAAMLPVGVMAPLGEVIIAGLVVLPLVGLAWRRRGAAAFAAIGRDPLTWLLAALCAWAALSALWSPDPTAGTALALRLVALSLGGLVLLAATDLVAGDERTRLLDGLSLGFAAAAVLLASELILGAPVSRMFHTLPPGLGYAPAHFDRGLTVAVLLAWPVAWHLRHRLGRWAALATIAAGVALPFMSSSRASMLAMILALPGWVAVRYGGRRWGGAALAALILGICLVPVALGELWQHGFIFAGVDLPRLQMSRLGIWDYGVDLFLRRPFGGWGLDASRYIGPDTVIVSPFRRLELHPHNALIQVALELGLPGILLCLAALVLVLRRILALAAPAARAAAAAQAVVLLTVSAVSYGVWQYWWQASCWLAIAFLALARSDPNAAGPGGRASSAAP